MADVIYTCDSCHYIFAAKEGGDQCPDCGKKQVRPANEEENQEYQERRKNSGDWN